MRNFFKQEPSQLPPNQDSIKNIGQDIQGILKSPEYQNLMLIYSGNCEWFGQRLDEIDKSNDSVYKRLQWEVIETKIYPALRNNFNNLLETAKIAKKKLGEDTVLNQEEETIIFDDCINNAMLTIAPLITFSKTDEYEKLKTSLKKELYVNDKPTNK